jgi:hypothetical protein
MRSQSDRDFLGVLLLPLLGLACCVGLPLLLSVGAGAAIWVFGAGAPLALAVVLGGLAIQRRRQRRVTSDPQVGGGPGGCARALVSAPGRRSAATTPPGRAPRR